MNTDYASTMFGPPAWDVPDLAYVRDCETGAKFAGADRIEAPGHGSCQLPDSIERTGGALPAVDSLDDRQPLIRANRHRRERRGRRQSWTTKP